MLGGAGRLFAFRAHDVLSHVVAQRGVHLREKVRYDASRDSFRSSVFCLPSTLA